MKKLIEIHTLLLIEKETSNAIYYHGSKDPIQPSIGNLKPIFFTKEIAYAKNYGPKVFKYNIDFNKLFNTENDKNAVEIYNQKFLPYAKVKAKSQMDRWVDIKFGEYIHFTCLDLLWVFLRISKRSGDDFGYDGIVCDEGGFETSDASKLSYIPLDLNQIHQIK